MIFRSGYSSIRFAAAMRAELMEPEIPEDRVRWQMSLPSFRMGRNRASYSSGFIWAVVGMAPSSICR